jgi:hypothetical protein
MPFGRLLLAAIFLCSLPAFTQDSRLISEKPTIRPLQAPEFRTAPPPRLDEPWRIIPKSDKDKGFVLNTPEMDRKGIAVSPDGPLASDFTCLSIRSYVVKRDTKNSDSVHPAGYSTCVPAKRFSLKTADASETVSLRR